MKELSTYSLLGIPDTVATALVLVSLSLLLAPWFGGSELGPLKVPQLTKRPRRILRYGAPILFSVAVGAFYPVWTQQGRPSQPSVLNELAMQWLETEFGDTVWNGGEIWGTITFDSTGRVARYTNAPGRVGGSINLKSEGHGGSGFILIYGKWVQEDGKEGELELLISGLKNDAKVRWGPDMSIVNEWKKANNKTSEKPNTEKRINETIAKNERVAPRLTPVHCKVIVSGDHDPNTDPYVNLARGPGVFRVKMQVGASAIKEHLERHNEYGDAAMGLSTYQFGNEQPKFLVCQSAACKDQLFRPFRDDGGELKRREVKHLLRNNEVYVKLPDADTHLRGFFYFFRDGKETSQMADKINEGISYGVEVTPIDVSASDGAEITLNCTPK